MDRKSHSGLMVWLLLPALIRSLLPVCRLLGVIVTSPLRVSKWL